MWDDFIFIVYRYIYFMKMKKWSSQWTQFIQLRKEAWKKFRTPTGFEPVTSRLPVWYSTNWAMKPLTLGAGQLWVHMFPWKKWVLMIYEINHIWPAEMKWKWRNNRFTSFKQFIYDLFHISLTDIFILANKFYK